MDEDEIRKRVAELNQITYLVGIFLVEMIPKVINDARIYEATNYVADKMIGGSEMIEAQLKNLQQMSDEEARELANKYPWER